MNRKLAPSDSVRCLSGVGDVRAKALQKMGIHTLYDLLRTFPRAYENRGNIRKLSDCTDGTKSAFLLTIASPPRTIRLRDRLSITKFKAFDESGTVEVVFYNQDYVRNVFNVGTIFRFWGTLNFSKTWTLSSPEYEAYRSDRPLPDYISVYSTTEGITRKVIEKLIDEVLTVTIDDFLPDDIRLRNHLPVLTYAYRHIHHPETPDHLEHALRRLVFDELFCMSLAVAADRAQAAIPSVFPYRLHDLSPFFAQLPYQLTNAQKRIINELASDMTSDASSPIPAMRRIIIGDVGSGKTVCAAAALYLTVVNGGQAALMAPTGILATQHYHEISNLFAKFDIRVALLTGATPAKERKRILEQLQDPISPISVLIGTHALLNENVTFANLKLTVTDEQHRFGIVQRAALERKANGGHLLVMSATPIPRTLALSLYGNLSISHLDEMPVGRQRVDTFVVTEAYRDRLNTFIASQVAEGGQVYIVCPAIETEDEEKEDIPLNSLHPIRKRELKSAVAVAKELREQVFPHLSVGLLHGKMKADEKDAIMNCFIGRDIDILVSTTVIEVGVNVPNATLMIVENAENFGLSQLHQLRGRVGRGTRKSYCVLVSSFEGAQAKERLQIMTTTNDGYEIAERDLLLRGPGDFFSGASNSEMRQSGGFNLKLAKCCDDPDLMTAAFSEASNLIKSDPSLVLPEHADIRAELEHYFSSTDNIVS